MPRRRSPADPSPENPWRSRIVGEADVAPGDLTANALNWRRHPEAQRAAMAGALSEIGWVQRIVVNRRTGNVVDGHLRLDLALQQQAPSVPVLYVDLSDDEERLVLATLDPLGALAESDAAALAALGVAPADESLRAMLDEMLARDREGGGAVPDGDGAAPPSPTLADRFLVPPFSVLDARQGYWQERKRQWIGIGIRSELGRGGDLIAYSEGAATHYRDAAPGGSPRPAASLGPDGRTRRGDGRGKAARTFGQDLMRGEHQVGAQPEAAGMRARPPHGATVRQNPDGTLNYAPSNNGEGQSGTSVFDPVLCELAYRWFSPPGGRILDPFAGGSVRGIVASMLGRDYTGIDLSARQIEANREQAATILPADAPAPRWVVGDSADVVALAPGEYDLLFSCPPYADLEVYSDDPRDLSTMDYRAFIGAYRQIIAASVGMLRDDRFACFVVGDLRDRKGIYRNFVSQTIDAFEAAGARLYNEAILVTAVGSLSIRVGRQFAGGRKLGKTHQNVLVFVKGDWRRATAACGPVDVTLALPDAQPE